MNGPNKQRAKTRHWNNNKDSELSAEAIADWRSEFSAKQSSSRYQSMLGQRKRLPAFKNGDAVVDTIAKNQVVVISGETGCGKTTQVPQLILEHEMLNGRGHMCNIICTQPRRISAMELLNAYRMKCAKRLALVSLAIKYA